MADLRILQNSFSAGELSPALWARTDMAKYRSGLKMALNVVLHPHGGVSNRAGMEFLGEVALSEKPTRMIPFIFNSDQAYILEFGHYSIRFYRDGGLILKHGVPYQISSPYNSSQLFDIIEAQEADVMFLAHEEHAPQKLSRYADDHWVMETVNFGTKIESPKGITATATRDSYALRQERSHKPFETRTSYFYKVSAISEESGESLPSYAATCYNDLITESAENKVTWNAVSGARAYHIYKCQSTSGSFGYIARVEGALEFIDRNVTPDFSDGPRQMQTLFQGVGTYPRLVAFIEQRLAFAASVNEPQTVWMSRTANYENFDICHPLKADDAIVFRIKSAQANEIRALISRKGVLILTSGAEWLVDGGMNSDAITPSSLRVVNQGYRGCSRVRPLMIGNAVLFSQNRGGVIRDLSFDFGEDGFTDKDLTILARHLFEGREIRSWAFSQSPSSIVWVVLEDGSLLSLTYMKEHDIWGWTRHETDGHFEDVAVIGEGREDAVYCIVRRRIGEQEKRYIERFCTRYFTTVEDAFFVDSGLSYEGEAIDRVFVPHLKGKQLVALVDGNVVRGLVADRLTGEVMLPVAGIKIHIGLPYEAVIQTLDLDLGQIPGLGTVQGRMLAISKVVLRVEKTRGIWIGSSFGLKDKSKLIEYKQRSTEAWNEAIQAYSGDIEITPHWNWSCGGNLVVKQFDPLPMTILAVMGDVAIGR
ncbi:MAG: hypothetical protein JSC189_001032 [Candidatus Tokpelaia sp. JSC189]|nr:MAG: hypothetical protein JSC189_001032 [Candidatus Tokpelaia sp. JSC189]